MHHYTSFLVSSDNIEELRKRPELITDDKTIFLYAESIEMFKFLESCIDIDLHNDKFNSKNYLEIQIQNHKYHISNDNIKYKEFIEYIENRMKPVKSAKLRF
jgi:hypothetical protein